jgi:hypothetical protein
MPQTEQLPPSFRFGARTLFRLAAQEREQNFGFLVLWPQTGHSATAILSEPRFALRGSSLCRVLCLCRDCTVTT